MITSLYGDILKMDRLSLTALTVAKGAYRPMGSIALRLRNLFPCKVKKNIENTVTSGLSNTGLPRYPIYLTPCCESSSDST